MKKLIDLHGMVLCQVTKSIQKLIANNPNCDEIIAIHGYNNGTTIKNFLSNKNNLHNKRVLNTYSDEFNNGITHIVLKRGENIETI